ncbi:Dps family protein [Angustibacter sp. Root456]|uniref:Dps family protein n=1 Tax=Angustibacter sp. Root456 TaxID=1736539 RepID=UPI000701A545|nr:DNA starvation/stationary phase protection protein [Angustibacter sp. Root456]KQX65637.1 DNA starvation/stationary phase protection protein [Angustibacter sp. Root456]
MADQTPRFTVPGLSQDDAATVGAILQDRLNALNDLALTLKHVHWNVIGQNFIAVHEMLDPQIDAVRAMVDEAAERMATLGVAPQGTPGAIVSQRSWDDYSLGRATTQEHLGALDLVFAGVISDHRKAQEQTADLDPVTEDLVIGQLRQLELFHWFVRAHLENLGGELSTSGATTETEAAQQAG